jgi:hypothetical protein
MQGIRYTYNFFFFFFKYYNPPFLLSHFFAHEIPTHFSKSHALKGARTHARTHDPEP